jgi:hypothetical protein
MFKNRCSGLDPETKRGIWNVLFEIKVLYLWIDHLFPFLIEVNSFYFCI